jgi:hypothetical protein
MGYLEAKDYGWDASSGNNAYLLSPAWSYNKLTYEGSGTNQIETGLLLEEWGAATWATIPYTDTDYTNWGNESAWREAPLHRPLQFNWLSYLGDPTITTIKNLVEGRTPVTFNIDANGYDQGLGDNYIISSAEYSSNTINHAQCIVGFDDSITEDGDVGAFRVVNSWGDSWADGGFYWLTYETLKEIGALGDGYIQIGCYDDRIDYEPNLVATWEFSSAPTRMDDIITLGVGPHGSPLNTLNPVYEEHTTALFPSFMALDISEFQPHYNSNNDVLFYLELGSSNTPGIISSFRIERYVAGILEEITPESPDVPKTTPGYVYGTFMDLAHELSVSLDTPVIPEIDNTYTINATVFNNGENDEINIDLFLYLDDILVDSITIPSLLVGASETINYMWTPTEYKTYNFTAYAPPVPDELNIANNIATELILISSLRNYIMIEDYAYSWIDASGGTELILSDDGYATIALPFSFTFYDVAYSTIHLGANGYLSFTDSTPSDYSNDPIPSGDLDNYYLIAPFWDDIYLDYGGHIYVQSFGTYWVAEWLDVYSINSPLLGSFEVVLYNTGEIVFNYDYLDYTSSGYTCGLNLGVDIHYYNSYQGLNDLTDDLSILFTYESFDHDLGVSLEIPTAPEINNPYIINATVTNTGENDEINVDLFLYLDDVLEDSITISSLPVGASETINYMWTPTEYKTYNFTAYAPPVPDELNIANNIATELISIIETKLFDGMFISYNWTIFGEVKPSDFTYSYVSGDCFHLDWYMDEGGSISHMYWDVDPQTRIMENSDGDGWQFGNGVHTPIWIFTDISLGDEILIAIDAEGDHLFSVAGELIYDLPGFGLVDVWVLEDLTFPGGVAWYEKSTGILLNGDFYYAEGAGLYTFDFVDTNVEFTYLSFTHDLSVSLDTPVNPEIGNSYLIDATVTNTGLNDEYDVDLLLYLDDVIVESTTISNLPVGASETISYMWIPPDFGYYNFTAYAPPVTDEIYTENNFITEIILIVDSILFDGMYIAHDLTDYNIDQLNANIIYSSLSVDIFNAQWSFDTMLADEWQVDTNSREITGSGFFSDYTHTPFWIFTDISLGDAVLISSIWDVDHTFEVQDELIYDLPGFGSIEIWVLQDLGHDNCSAWYEKSTGILINGMFYYEGGYNYVILEFMDTNVEFTYYEPLSLTITTPDSASSWETDTSQSITWTSIGSISDVKIELYENDVFIMEIVASTPNDGEFSWLIPTTLVDSTQYQVKISDVANPATDDFSDNFEIFTSIIDSITVTNPDSTSSWQTETTQSITWTSTGTISDVKIELYKGGVFEMEIVATTTNDGTYNWAIPIDLEDGIDYKIKISDVSNLATYGESSNFVINSFEIPGYNLYIVMGIMCVVSVILFKKRFKLIK